MPCTEQQLRSRTHLVESQLPSAGRRYEHGIFSQCTVNGIHACFPLRQDTGFSSPIRGLPAPGVFWMLAAAPATSCAPLRMPVTSRPAWNLIQWRRISQLATVAVVAYSHSHLNLHSHHPNEVFDVVTFFEVLEHQAEPNLFNPRLPAPVWICPPQRAKIASAGNPLRMYWTIRQITFFVGIRIRCKWRWRCMVSPWYPSGKKSPHLPIPLSKSIMHCPLAFPAPLRPNGPNPFGTKYKRTRSRNCNAISFADLCVVARCKSSNILPVFP
jgi:hypothetical protein